MDFLDYVVMFYKLVDDIEFLPVSDAHWRKNGDWVG